jgi:hypothetical protein
MKSGSRLFLMGAAVVMLAALDLALALAAPIMRDAAVTSAEPT